MKTSTLIKKIKILRMMFKDVLLESTASIFRVRVSLTLSSTTKMKAVYSLKTSFQKTEIFKNGEYFYEVIEAGGNIYLLF
jgi:hypothetical protein